MRAAYMRQWRKKRKAEHACECGAETNGYMYCLDCRLKRYLNQFRWRRDNPNYHREYWAEHKDKINARRRKVVG